MVLIPFDKLSLVASTAFPRPLKPCQGLPKYRTLFFIIIALGSKSLRRLYIGLHLLRVRHVGSEMPTGISDPTCLKGSKILKLPGQGIHPQAL